MKVNVRNMQRVPHIHNQRIVHNDRYWCDVCNYAWPRSKFYANGKSPFSKQARHNWAKALRDAPMATEFTDPNKFTVPKLREIVTRNKPNLKGVGKMRKAELVSALLES